MTDKKAVFIATWFKTGLIPSFLPTEMGGTYGSFFALPLCIAVVLFVRFMRGTSDATFGVLWVLVYSVLMVYILYLGTETIGPAERALGPRKDHKGKVRDHDQNCIVIDEVFGMLIACLPLTNTSIKLNWIFFLYAFLLFRAFDIIKVPPTRYFDRMKNPFGVMMDDFVAGIYAMLVLSVILSFYWK